MLRALAIWLVVAAATSATAQAATVAVNETAPGRYDPGESHLVFTAADGERNDVTLTRDGATFVVRDAGAPVTTGAGCAAIDPWTASCTLAQSILTARVDLGDLDDTFAGTGGRELVPLAVQGGDGADTLTGPGKLEGGPGPDVLTGSPGEDVLAGGAGDDVLRGLGGRDLLGGDGGSGSAADDDLIDGGDGLDSALYAGRPDGVRVDLSDPAPDGHAGERDRLIGIENVAGGRGADVLIGDDGPNNLQGSAGDDRLDGRGGDDWLTDGDGADVLRGGAGADRIAASGAGDRAFGGAGSDSLTAGTDAALDGGSGDDLFGVLLGNTYSPPACGAGRDVLADAPHRGERIRRDCEVARFGPYGFFQASATPGPNTPGLLRIGMACNELAAHLDRCDGRVTLRLRRAGARPLTLGRRRVVLGAQTMAVLAVTVRRAARRAWARARRPLIEVEIDVTARGELPHGTPYGAGRWTVRLP